MKLIEQLNNLPKLRIWIKSCSNKVLRTELNLNKNYKILKII